MKRNFLAVCTSAVLVLGLSFAGVTAASAEDVVTPEATPVSEVTADSATPAAPVEAAPVAEPVAPAVEVVPVETAPAPVADAVSPVANEVPAANAARAGPVAEAAVAANVGVIGTSTPNSSATNQASYWNNKFEHPAQCYKHESNDTNNDHASITNNGKTVVLKPFNPSWGTHWEAVIVKAGNFDVTTKHPTAGVEYAAVEYKDVSHYIVCKGTVPTTPIINEIPYPTLVATVVCGPKNDTVVVDPTWLATYGKFVDGPWIDSNYKIVNGKAVVDGSANIKAEFRSTYIWAGTAGTSASDFTRWRMYPGTPAFTHVDTATECPKTYEPTCTTVTGSKVIEGDGVLTVSGDWATTSIDVPFSGTLADIGTQLDLTASDTQYLGLHIDTAKGTIVFEEEASYTGRLWSESTWAGVDAGLGYNALGTIEEFIELNGDVAVTGIRLLYTSPDASTTTVESFTIGCTLYTFEQKPEDKVTIDVVTTFDCTTKVATETTTTTTVGTKLVDNKYVPTEPVVVVTTATRPMTDTEIAKECPVVVPPQPEDKVLTTVNTTFDCDTSVATVTTTTTTIGTELVENEWVETEPVTVITTATRPMTDIEIAEECPVVVPPTTNPPVVNPPAVNPPAATPPTVTEQVVAQVEKLASTGTDIAPLLALVGGLLGLGLAFTVVALRRRKATEN